jgi:hypothetical protein
MAIVGNEITFYLMKRQKGNIIPVRYNHRLPSLRLPPDMDSPDAAFHKICVTRNDCAWLKRDLTELDRAVADGALPSCECFFFFKKK